MVNYGISNACWRYHSLPLSQRVVHDNYGISNMCWRYHSLPLSQWVVHDNYGISNMCWRYHSLPLSQWVVHDNYGISNMCWRYHSLPLSQRVVYDNYGISNMCWRYHSLPLGQWVVYDSWTYRSTVVSQRTRSGRLGGVWARLTSGTGSTWRLIHTREFPSRTLDWGLVYGRTRETSRTRSTRSHLGKKVYRA